jgi:hypothetical protein
MNRYKDFGDIIEKYKNDVFEKYNDIIEPAKNVMLLFYLNDGIKIYNNIDKLKSDNLPLISDDFKIFIKESLLNNDIHCPINYIKCRDVNNRTFDYAPPEIIKEVWNNFKLSKIWYDKLLEIGYST